MYGLFAFLTLFGGLTTATTANVSDQHWITKESHPVPIGFAREGDAPSHQTIRLQIVLKQQRAGELEGHLADIYDPKHPRFGQYMTADEVADLTRPEASALEDVIEWLTSHTDHVELNRNGDLLSITATIAEAETLLNTSFGVYRHLDGTALIRAPEWKVPEHLQDHVWTVQPTTSFLRHDGRVTAWTGGESQEIPLPVLQERATTQNLDQVCNASAVTPLCLRTLVRYAPSKPHLKKKQCLHADL